MESTNAPKPPAVFAAIAAVMAELAREGITKDRRNTQGAGYNFRGIDDVYNVLAPIMSRHQLMMLPRATERHQEERTAKAGGALFYTTVKMDFVLACAVDGSTHIITTYGEAMDSSDKSTNKAMSAAFKYAAFQAFCIPTEGDNDADATTHEPAARSTKPAATKSATKTTDPVADAPKTVPLATRDQISELSALSLDGCEERINAALAAYKVKRIEDFTEKQAAAVLKKLNDERAASASTSVKP